MSSEHHPAEASQRADIERLADIQAVGELTDDTVREVVERERTMTKGDERDILHKIHHGEPSADETLAYGYRLLRDARAQNALDGLLGHGDDRREPHRSRRCEPEEREIDGYEIGY